jgi:hypothetical protein
MGAGIALECKQRYPEVYREYHRNCTMDAYLPGRIYGCAQPDILLAMTKDDWRDPSRLEWVDSILEAIGELCWITTETIALPPLGAGNGGLDGLVVLDHVHDALDNCPADIYYYLPR